MPEPTGADARASEEAVPAALEKKRVPASREAGTRLKLVRREPRWSYFVQPSSPEVCRVAQALASVAFFTATIGV